MNLDLRTQMLSGLVIYATLAFLAYEVYRKNRETVPCTFCWFAAFVSFTVGAAALALRGVIPTTLSILISNPALFGGYSLYLVAGAELSGRRSPRRALAAAAVLFFLVFSFFTFVVPSLPVRSAMITGAVVVLSAISAYQLGRPRDAERAGGFKTVAAVFSLLSLLHLLRLALILTVDVRPEFLAAPYWDVLFFMLGTALMVALTLSYLTAINGVISRRLHDSLSENRTLLKELRHRTKNNLTMIAGLVALQGDSVEGEDAKEAFRNLENRLSTIIAAYGLLSREGELSDGAADPADYLRELLRGLEDTIPPGRNVALDLDAPSGTRLPAAALVPLGLVVNELVVNALKHAFPAGRGGRIAVRYAATEGTASVTVEDDGAGFSEEGSVAKPSGLGLGLTATLAEQLRGSLRREVPDGGGARFVLEFPLG